MRRLVTALSAVAASAAVFAAVPAGAQPQNLPQVPKAEAVTTNPDTVVARVGDVEIRNADVAEAYDGLPEEYRQLPIGVLYRQLLNQLVNRELMLKAGLADNLDEDEEIVAQVREYRDFAIQRAYLDRYLAEAITEDALRAEYDATIGAQEGTTEIKASHILLQSEADAQAVIRELEDGADFAQLARDRSTGPSGTNGGDLGYFRREQMVEPFSDAAFAMEEGETSAAPVKTQFGWHVITITGRRVQPPPSFEQSREQIEDRLTRGALEAHMAELREATPVEMFNPDGSPLAPAEPQAEPK